MVVVFVITPTRNHIARVFHWQFATLLAVIFFKLFDAEVMCIHFDRSAVSSASDLLPPHLNVSCVILNYCVVAFRVSDASICFNTVVSCI